MKSKIELRKFICLKDAQNFVNCFEKEILRIEFIPLCTPSLNPHNIIFFVVIEYSEKINESTQI